MANICALAVLLYALALLGAVAGAESADDDIARSVIYAPTNRGLRPARFRAYDLIHYFQLQDNLEESTGTIVFFHGCARAARAFWPYDPQNCPECLGFPEHVSHVKQALAAGYNVVSMDPHDEKHLCWSSSNSNGYVNDQPDVVSTLSQFLVNRGLQFKPVFLWGASSGGTLALKMPWTLNAFARFQAQQAAKAELADGDRDDDIKAGYSMRVAGIISEVASPEDFGAFGPDGQLTIPNYPPTIFVGMANDAGLDTYHNNRDLFRKNGVPSEVIVSPRRFIGPLYFSRRIPVITPEQSARIVWGLKAINMLGDDGFLRADPSNWDDPRDEIAFNWPGRLKELLPWLSVQSRSLNLVFRTSPIHQALYVAYARHEAVSDYFTVCLKWLESGGKGDLPTLLHQWTVPDGDLSSLTPLQPFPPTPLSDDPPQQPRSSRRML